MSALSPAVIWALAGVACIVLEALFPGLIILFFGLGALLTAGATALFGLFLEQQLLVFVVTTLGTLLSLRNLFRTVFRGAGKGGEHLDARLGNYVGEAGVVTEAIPAGGSGRVKVRGSFYTATASADLPVGQAVKVVADTYGDHTLFVVEPA